MTDAVRTRFAPSPTGYLHVGGARTALFNWLLARRMSGVFILRIEDTDQTRNIERADEKLMDDLAWLGLNWDEGPRVEGPCGPYYQSRKLARYQECARRLLDTGKAYYAFDTREELEAMRKSAQREKRPFRYPRPAKFPSDADADRARGEGRPVVVRMRMPDRDFEIDDLILGKVRRAAFELDDFVIIKADGWPTYHFAVVVDDEDMKVTHVLRAQEHLMNTPNHMALQDALGFRVPAYAHLPIIMNMDGSKMSKREKDKAVRAALDAAIASGKLSLADARRIAGTTDESGFAAWKAGDTQLRGDELARLARHLAVDLPEIEIHDFRSTGYLPEVLLNFLALLGWSPGNDVEKMSVAQMCDLFSIDRVGKTNARFDRVKLLNFNTTAIAAVDKPRLLAGFKDYLSVNPPGLLNALPDATLSRLIEMNEGFRVFRDIEIKCHSMFADDAALKYDESAVQKVLRKNDAAGFAALRAAAGLLESASSWSASALEAVIKKHAEATGQNLGKIAQPIRVAVTGSTVSPPIFDTLEVIGRDKTLRRIRRALELEAAAV